MVAEAVSPSQICRLTVGWFVQMEALEKKSLRLCVTFLEQIAKMTSSVVLELCAEQCNLNQKVMSRFMSNRANYPAEADSAEPQIHFTMTLTVVSVAASVILSWKQMTD